jgi:hypothetical protein
MCGLQYIDNFKITEEYPADMYLLTRGRLQNSFPALFVTFKKDGKVTQHYIPIGLFAILEGFSRTMQDHYLLHYFPVEKVYKNNDEIMSEPKYLPYYILRYFALSHLGGLEKGESNAILLSSFYLALHYLKPIFCKQELFRFDLEICRAETEQFLSKITHPGHIFFESFFTMKEIVEKKGGIEPGEKGIDNLIHRACAQMDIPPLDLQCDVFRECFMRILSNYPLEFREFPFGTHFFNIALKLMRVAKDNIYDFMLFPSLVAEKVGNSINPLSIKGDYCTEASSEKTEWLIFYTIMEQFFHRKRIFCIDKFLFGKNPHCKNDGECSLDKIDYPYSKCDEVSIGVINRVVGNVKKLVPS